MIFQAEHYVGAAIVALLLVVLLRLVRWITKPAPYVRLSFNDYARGSVYIFQDKTDPNVIKIGMTRQLCVERRDQVETQMADDDRLILRQIYAIDGIHFPRSVESVAQQLESRHNIKWRNGSNRGREWFRARGDRGKARAIRSLDRAAKIVRKEAIRRGRWPNGADGYVRFWKLNHWGCQKGSLFG